MSCQISHSIHKHLGPSVVARCGEGECNNKDKREGVTYLVVAQACVDCRCDGAGVVCTLFRQGEGPRDGGIVAVTRAQVVVAGAVSLCLPMHERE